MRAADPLGQGMLVAQVEQVAVEPQKIHGSVLVHQLATAQLIRVAVAQARFHFRTEQKTLVLADQESL
jgi:hypothetical protein